MITSLTHLTLDIFAAVNAARKYHGDGVLILAKGNDGTAIVIKAIYPNRNRREIAYGYLRFGAEAPVWVGKRFIKQVWECWSNEVMAIAESTCREICNEATDAANAAETLRNLEAVQREGAERPKIICELS